MTKRLSAGKSKAKRHSVAPLKLALVFLRTMFSLRVDAKLV